MCPTRWLALRLMFFYVTGAYQSGGSLDVGRAISVKRSVMGGHMVATSQADGCISG